MRIVLHLLSTPWWLLPAFWLWLAARRGKITFDMQVRRARGE